MAKLIVKIILFILIMLLVAFRVPYDGLTSSIMSFFDFEQAEKITSFILGERDLEVMESLRSYINILINIAISVPLLSGLTVMYCAMVRKKFSMSDIKLWATETIRRFGKIFLLIFIFWVYVQLVPYEMINIGSREMLLFSIIVTINTLLTIITYRIIIMLFKKNKMRMNAS